MMQGINFGGEGPIMQGTWYNPHTGDAFTVRDSFFEDNQYIVMTTDGRKMDYNRLQNYIQSDMKLEDLKKMRVEKPEKEEIPAEIQGLIAPIDDVDDGLLLPEDDIFRPKSLGNINEPRHIAPASAHTHAGYTTSEPVNMNNAIIEKALKTTSKPNFIVNVEWTDYPERQIEMLKDVMDIPEEEILDWYLDNIDMFEIVEAVKRGIRNRIETDTYEFTEPLDITEIIDLSIVGNSTVEDEKPTVTVEKTPVVKKPTTAKKVTTTTKSAVKKPVSKKPQPKKSK